MKEMLYAWEQGTLSANDVKRILDVMRQRMCCLAITATAWLCSYMQIVQQDTLLKPMNMVQQFLTQINAEDNHDNFKERYSDFFTYKMYFHILCKLLKILLNYIYIFVNVFLVTICYAYFTILCIIMCQDIILSSGGI